MEFTLEGFQVILENYNTDIWPSQILAFLLGILTIFLTVKKGKFSSPYISTILALFWIWNGIVFCFFYWGQNYKPAYVMGFLFLIQGLLFIYAGVVRPKITFQYSGNLYSIFGFTFIFYAMVGYQVLGLFLGHRYPLSFPFGLVPCPTNVFTLGMFLLTVGTFPKYLLIIPISWALAGYIPISRGILEDIGMLAVGLLTGILIFWKFKKIQSIS